MALIARPYPFDSLKIHKAKVWVVVVFSALTAADLADWMAGWLTRGWVNDRLDDGETVVGCVSWTTDKLLVFIAVIIHTSCFHLFLGYILCFSDMTLFVRADCGEDGLESLICLLLALLDWLFTWLFEKQLYKAQENKI